MTSPLNFWLSSTQEYARQPELLLTAVACRCSLGDISKGIVLKKCCEVVAAFQHVTTRRQRTADIVRDRLRHALIWYIVNESPVSFCWHIWIQKLRVIGRPKVIGV